MAHMSRRRLVTSLATLAPLQIVAPTAIAATECWRDNWNRGFCRANIRRKNFRHYQGQKNLFWCWAATLSMVFGWHGKSISQEAIVQQTFGAQWNLAIDPFSLMESVNRKYRDDSGRLFSVRSRVYSADTGIIDINNCDIIDELKNENPLVVCNLTHMMVLIGVDYFSDAPCTTMNVSNAWVADPFPGVPFAPDMGPGFRDLTPAELVPVHLGGQLRFMSTIRVS